MSERAQGHDVSSLSYDNSCKASRLLRTAETHFIRFHALYIHSSPPTWSFTVTKSCARLLATISTLVCSTIVSFVQLHGTIEL